MGANDKRKYTKHNEIIGANQIIVILMRYTGKIHTGQYHLFELFLIIYKM